LHKRQISRLIHIYFENIVLMLTLLLISFFQIINITTYMNRTCAILSNTSVNYTTRLMTLTVFERPTASNSNFPRWPPNMVAIGCVDWMQSCVNTCAEQLTKTRCYYYFIIISIPRASNLRDQPVDSRVYSIQ